MFRAIPFVLLFSCGLAVAAPPASQPADRQALEKALDQYARSDTKDEAARKSLLAGGETAIEVILDAVYGRASVDLTDEQLDQLVARLGHDDYETREAATRELISRMPSIGSRLLKYKNHADAEVATRITTVLNTPERPLDPEALSAKNTTLAAATTLFELDFPVKQLRAVARRNIDRLASLKEVPANWNLKPIAPMLASLRISDDAADRDLLKTVLSRARDGSAVVCLVIMKEGLKQRDRPGLPEYWSNLPEHDYSDCAWEFMDVKRPRVFIEAMALAPRGDKLIATLKTAYTQVSDERLKLRIEAMLWRLGATDSP